MKKGLLSKIAVSLGMACVCASMAFVAPTAALRAEAATIPGGASTQAYIIDYCYKIENGALYKRLYNYSTRQFIGDWIFLRYLTQEDYENMGWV